MSFWNVAAFVVGTLIGLVTSAMQARQQKKMQRKAKEAADKAKGFQVVVDGEPSSICIPYGNQKLGGVQVFWKVMGTYVPPTSRVILGSTGHYYMGKSGETFESFEGTTIADTIMTQENDLSHYDHPGLQIFMPYKADGFLMSWRLFNTKRDWTGEWKLDMRPKAMPYVTWFTTPGCEDTWYFPNVYSKDGEFSTGPKIQTDEDPNDPITVYFTSNSNYTYDEQIAEYDKWFYDMRSLGRTQMAEVTVTIDKGGDSIRDKAINAICAQNTTKAPGKGIAYSYFYKEYNAGAYPLIKSNTGFNQTLWLLDKDYGKKHPSAIQNLDSSRKNKLVELYNMIKKIITENTAPVEVNLNNLIELFKYELTEEEFNKVINNNNDTNFNTFFEDEVKGLINYLDEDQRDDYTRDLGTIPTSFYGTNNKLSITYDFWLRCRAVPIKYQVFYNDATIETQAHLVEFSGALFDYVAKDLNYVYDGNWSDDLWTRNGRIVGLIGSKNFWGVDFKSNENGTIKNLRKPYQYSPNFPDPNWDFDNNKPMNWDKVNFDEVNKNAPDILSSNWNMIFEWYYKGADPSSVVEWEVDKKTQTYKSYDSTVLEAGTNGLWPYKHIIWVQPKEVYKGGEWKVDPNTSPLPLKSLGIEFPTPPPCAYFRKTKTEHQINDLWSRVYDISATKSFRNFLFIQQIISIEGLHKAVYVNVDDLYYNDPSFQNGCAIQVNTQGGYKPNQWMLDNELYHYYWMTAGSLAESNSKLPWDIGKGIDPTVRRREAVFYNLAYVTGCFNTYVNEDDNEPQFNGAPAITTFAQGREVPMITPEGQWNWQCVNGEWVKKAAYDSLKESGLFADRLSDLSYIKDFSLFSTNPILILHDYMTNDTYGCKIGFDEIDYESFYKAFLICDRELASLGTSGKFWSFLGTSRRLRLFECCLALDTKEDFRTNINKILDTMYECFLIWSDGKYKISLIYPRLYDPALDEELLIISNKISLSFKDKNKTEIKLTVNKSGVTVPIGSYLINVKNGCNIAQIEESFTTGTVGSTQNIKAVLDESTHGVLYDSSYAYSGSQVTVDKTSRDETYTINNDISFLVAYQGKKPVLPYLDEEIVQTVYTLNDAGKIVQSANVVKIGKGYSRTKDASTIIINETSSQNISIPEGWFIMSGDNFEHLLGIVHNPTQTTGSSLTIDLKDIADETRTDYSKDIYIVNPSNAKVTLNLFRRKNGRWYDDVIAREITDDDLLLDSEIILEYPKLEDKLNYCTVRYCNDEKDFEEESVSWPNKTPSDENYDHVYKDYLAEDNQKLLEEEFFAEGITDRYHAKAFAEQRVRMSRYKETYSFKTTFIGMYLEPGDIIAFSSKTYDIPKNIKYPGEPGYSRLNLRITEVKPEDHGVYNIKAYSFDASLLAENAKDEDDVKPIDIYSSNNIINSIQNLRFIQDVTAEGLKRYYLEWDAPSGGASNYQIEYTKLPISVVKQTLCYKAFLSADKKTLYLLDVNKDAVFDGDIPLIKDGASAYSKSDKSLIGILKLSKSVSKSDIDNLKAYYTDIGQMLANNNGVPIKDSNKAYYIVYDNNNTEEKIFDTLTKIAGTNQAKITWPEGIVTNANKLTRGTLLVDSNGNHIDYVYSGNQSHYTLGEMEKIADEIYINIDGDKHIIKLKNPVDDIILSIGDTLYNSVGREICTVKNTYNLNENRIQLYYKNYGIKIADKIIVNSIGTLSNSKRRYISWGTFNGLHITPPFTFSSYGWLEANPREDQASLEVEGNFMGNFYGDYTFEGSVFSTSNFILGGGYEIGGGFDVTNIFYFPPDSPGSNFIYCEIEVNERIYDNIGGGIYRKKADINYEVIYLQNTNNTGSDIEYTGGIYIRNFYTGTPRTLLSLPLKSISTNANTIFSNGVYLSTSKDVYAYAEPVSLQTSTSAGIIVDPVSGGAGNAITSSHSSSLTSTQNNLDNITLTPPNEEEKVGDLVVKQEEEKILIGASYYISKNSKGEYSIRIDTMYPSKIPKNTALYSKKDDTLIGYTDEAFEFKTTLVKIASSAKSTPGNVSAYDSMLYNCAIGTKLKEYRNLYDKNGIYHAQVAQDDYILGSKDCGLKLYWNRTNEIKDGVFIVDESISEGSQYYIKIKDIGENVKIKEYVNRGIYIKSSSSYIDYYSGDNFETGSFILAKSSNYDLSQNSDYIKIAAGGEIQKGWWRKLKLIDIQVNGGIHNCYFRFKNGVEFAHLNSGVGAVSGSSYALRKGENLDVFLSSDIDAKIIAHDGIYVDKSEFSEARTRKLRASNDINDTAKNYVDSNINIGYLEDDLIKFNNIDDEITKNLNLYKKLSDGIIFTENSNIITLINPIIDLEIPTNSHLYLNSNNLIATLNIDLSITSENIREENDNTYIDTEIIENAAESITYNETVYYLGEEDVILKENEKIPINTSELLSSSDSWIKVAEGITLNNSSTITLINPSKDMIFYKATKIKFKKPEAENDTILTVSNFTKLEEDLSTFDLIIDEIIEESNTYNVDVYMLSISEIFKRVADGFTVDLSGEEPIFKLKNPLPGIELTNGKNLYLEDKTKIATISENLKFAEKDLDLIQIAEGINFTEGSNEAILINVISGIEIPMNTSLYFEDGIEVAAIDTEINTSESSRIHLPIPSEITQEYNQNIYIDNTLNQEDTYCKINVLKVYTENFATRSTEISIDEDVFIKPDLTYASDVSIKNNTVSYEIDTSKLDFGLYAFSVKTSSGENVAATGAFTIGGISNSAYNDYKKDGYDITLTQPDVNSLWEKISQKENYLCISAILSVKSNTKRVINLENLNNSTYNSIKAGTILSTINTLNSEEIIIGKVISKSSLVKNQKALITINLNKNIDLNSLFSETTIENPEANTQYYLINTGILINEIAFEKGLKYLCDIALISKSNTQVICTLKYNIKNTVFSNLKANDQLLDAMTNELIGEVISTYTVSNSKQIVLDFNTDITLKNADVLNPVEDTVYYDISNGINVKKVSNTSSTNNQSYTDYDEEEESSSIPADIIASKAQVKVLKGTLNNPERTAKLIIKDSDFSSGIKGISNYAWSSAAYYSVTSSGDIIIGTSKGHYSDFSFMVDEVDINYNINCSSEIIEDTDTYTTYAINTPIRYKEPRNVPASDYDFIAGNKPPQYNFYKLGDEGYIHSGSGSGSPTFYVLEVKNINTSNLNTLKSLNLESTEYKVFCENIGSSLGYLNKQLKNYAGPTDINDRSNYRKVGYVSAAVGLTQYISTITNKIVYYDINTNSYTEEGPYKVSGSGASAKTYTEENLDRADRWYTLSLNKSSVSKADGEIYVRVDS